jgi:hypothetical protein
MVTVILITAIAAGAAGTALTTVTTITAHTSAGIYINADDEIRDFKNNITAVCSVLAGGSGRTALTIPTGCSVTWLGVRCFPGTIAGCTFNSVAPHTA